MTIKVCDMVMGSGKTESAITRMNEDKDSKYIFITPYLDEVDRIKDSCSDRKFKEPENRGDGKLDSLHYLLGNGYNIASTHALFKQYSDYTLELIMNGSYKLILDEVFDVVEQVEISKKDLKLLIDNKIISIEKQTDKVIWKDEEYDGKFKEIMRMAQNGDLFLYKEKLIFWTFPIKVFKAFQDVIILTYMFNAQMQKYYYDLYKIDVEYIGTSKINGIYRFSENIEMPQYTKYLKSKIHILQDEKLNRIGDYQYALSVSWFEREIEKNTKPLISKLKNNLINLYKQKYKVPLENRMWTTFKEVKNYIKGTGYSTAFVSFNLRATNEYREKTHLAYCVNVYMKPVYKNFFHDKGVTVLEDRFALSEMIQWIWRSAIRDGKDIWIYIPSSRMRELLEDWLEELNKLNK